METEEPKIRQTLSEYGEKARKIINDPSLIEDTLNKAWNKAKSLDPALESLMTAISSFAELVKAYITGEYRDVELKTIILMLAGLLYFLNPFDLIPDFLPFLGFADDAALMLFLLTKVKSEIRKYNNWKNDESNIDYGT